MTEASKNFYFKNHSELLDKYFLLVIGEYKIMYNYGTLHSFVIYTTAAVHIVKNTQPKRKIRNGGE